MVTRLRALFSKKNTTIEAVDLNEATREVIALSSHELQRNRVILRLELADDLPPVTGDRVQLQQLILNLLLNASEAMSGVDDRPRRLVIRTERDECDGVRLSVQDARVGFDPQRTLRCVLHHQEWRYGDRPIRQSHHRRESSRPFIGGT